MNNERQIYECLFGENSLKYALNTSLLTDSVQITDCPSSFF